MPSLLLISPGPGAASELREGTAIGDVSELLHRTSWRAERIFRQRGELRGLLWTVEDCDGQRAMFETALMVGDIPEYAAWAALRAEVQADFAHDHIVRYAVAFPATLRLVLADTILHQHQQRQTRRVIAFEAHDGDTHLRSAREIIGNQLTALEQIESAGQFSRFGELCPCFA